MTNLRPSSNPERIGTCELCGGHGRQLGILLISDFIGWACEQCRRELGQSLPRRYNGAGEETEPGE